VVGKCKIGEEPLRVLKISTAPSTFNKGKLKNGTSEKRDANCYIFANSHCTSLLSLLLTDG
jgi:hypothetical protein